MTTSTEVGERPATVEGSFNRAVGSINEVARATEDPSLADALVFHEVSEREKRHGQAVAAASLPPLG